MPLDNTNWKDERPEPRRMVCGRMYPVEQFLELHDHEVKYILEMLKATCTSMQAEIMWPVCFRVWVENAVVVIEGKARLK